MHYCIAVLLTPDKSSVGICKTEITIVSLGFQKEVSETEYVQLLCWGVSLQGTGDKDGTCEVGQEAEPIMDVYMFEWFPLEETSYLILGDYLKSCVQWNSDSVVWEDDGKHLSIGSYPLCFPHGGVSATHLWTVSFACLGPSGSDHCNSHSPLTKRFPYWAPRHSPPTLR